MKFLVIGVIVALCIAQSHQGGMNDAAKAMMQAKEKLKEMNPGQIIKNMTQALVTSLPEELVHVGSQNIVKNFIHNATSPENIRVLMRLVKDSKMKKKGEIVRIILRCMNPENWETEAIIHIIQSLDSITVSELTGITIEYIKEVAPRFLESNYPIFEKFFNLINPDDAKNMAKFWFEVVAATESKDLAWFIAEFIKELKAFFDLGKKYISVTGAAIAHDFHNNGTRYLQDKAKQYVNNAKKVANFEKFSPQSKKFTEIMKTAAIHFVNTSIDEIKEEMAHLNITGDTFNITHMFKQLTHTISQLWDFIDIDEMGADVERAVLQFKALNKTSALKAEKDILRFVPNVEGIIKILNSSAILNKVNKEGIFAILRIVGKFKVPDGVMDGLNELILSAVSLVDEKILRAGIEFFVKESKLDNPIYKAFKAIVLRNIRDLMEKHYLNLHVSNLDDFKIQLVNFIEHIDEKMVQELIVQGFADIKHLNPSTVSDMIAESSSIANVLLMDNTMETIILHPMSFLDVVNKTMFSNFITFNLNAIKLINESQVSYWCIGFASLATDEISKRVDNATMWFKQQFELVENGHKVADNIKINETTDVIAKIVKTMDMKQACNDLSSLFKLNRALSNAARAEIVNLMWSAFTRLQKVASGDVVNQQMVLNIKEILNAFLRTLLKVNDFKPNLQTRVVRAAIRNVDDYSKTGRLRLRFRSTPEEEREDRKLYQELAMEIDPDLIDEPYDMSDTNIPYDPNVRYGLKIPEDTMVTPLATHKHTEKSAGIATTTKHIDNASVISITTPKHTDNVTVISTTPPKNTDNAPVFSTTIPNHTEISKSAPKIHRQEHISAPLRIMPETDGSKCYKDVHDVISAAWAGQTWARKMLDGWLQLGTQNSSTCHSGLANKCYSIIHPSGSFKPKFCAANISMPFIWPGEVISEIKAFRSGICVPSTCNVSEFSRVLKYTLQGSTMTLVIDPASCSSRDSSGSFGSAYQIMLAIIACIILVCTAIDVLLSVCTKHSQPTRLIQGLSLRTTTGQCFSQSADDGSVGVVHGLRTVGIAWAVACCSLQCLVSSGIITNKEVTHNIWLTVPLNLYAASDFLLFAGGALSAVSFLTAIGENGHRGVIIKIIKKILTWFPCIVVVMFVRNEFFNHSGSAPCGRSWWHHILFIQNFMTADETCLPQSWYLSLEMQLFVLTPLILYIPISTKRVKTIIGLIASAATVVLPIVFLTANKDPLVPFPTVSNSQFQWDLVKPYTRLVPWLFGVVVGEIIHGQNSSAKFNLSKKISFAAMFFSLKLLAICVFTAKFFSFESREHWQIAVYLGISHLAVSLALAIIAILCANRPTGFVRGVMTSAILQGLGKLAFCIYLVHMSIVEIKTLQSYATYLDSYTIVNGMISDYVVSVVAGTILHLFVQLPVSNICDMILKEQTSRPTSIQVLIPPENGGNGIVTKHIS